MSDYTKLDAEILRRIGGVGPFTFTGLWIAVEKFVPNQGPQTFRVVDRRLQALRKAGKITYRRKEGWRLTAHAPPGGDADEKERG